MSLRLVNGANRTEGRLEVKVYGEWGSVCDDDFTEAAAMTVCRQLGLPGRARVHKEAHFGQGKGIIWMDEVSVDVDVEFGAGAGGLEKACLTGRLRSLLRSAVPATRRLSRAASTTTSA